MDDDLPVGRILSRRDVVRLLAVASAAAAAGCGRDRVASAESASGGGAARGPGAASIARTPACVARPELTVGPYFLDEQLERSDIRVEPTTGTAKDGAPLALTFNVSRIDGAGCTPLAGAVVDVWQCDAAGVYSGVQDRMVGFDSMGQKFLRGFQRTDGSGVARFVTIYPGWYAGRTVHIHFKIRAESAPDQGYEFTSQLFFPESLTDEVHARAPYAAKGRRDLTNVQDGIFRQGGDGLLLAPASSAEGYSASFDVGLDLSDAEVGRPDRSRGPGGRPPRRPRA